jgi:hypothetical protein
MALFLPSTANFSPSRYIAIRGWAATGANADLVCLHKTPFALTGKEEVGPALAPVHAELIHAVARAPAALVGINSEVARGRGPYCGVAGTGTGPIAVCQDTQLIR